MVEARRIIIVSGGTIGDRAHDILSESQLEDLLVGVDRGTLALIEHQFQPVYAFGDFDSVNSEEMALIESKVRQIRSFDAIDKDWTDTELAFHWALKQNPQQILLLGGTGTRLDHSLSNVFLLEAALEKGIDCRMIDEHNEVRLINRPCTIVHGPYQYVSLLSLSDVSTGITLEGFQYPLHQATLFRGQSLGVSNVLIDETGTIMLESGLLLVIQSKD